jgi:hypothetical protein
MYGPDPIGKHVFHVFPTVGLTIPTGATLCFCLHNNNRHTQSGGRLNTHNSLDQHAGLLRCRKVRQKDPRPLRKCLHAQVLARQTCTNVNDVTSCN